MCNIINNSQGSSDRGTLPNWNSVTAINKCCLIKNNANFKGYLFYNSRSTIEVRECTIQNGYNKYVYSGTFKMYSNTVAGSTCAVMKNCGANIWNNEEKIEKLFVSDETFTNNLLKVLILLKYISFIE
jgi:hypothetical protein